MSEGREKPLSLESIFNQGPEFYQFINGNQQQPPAQYPMMHAPVHPQQWANPMYQQLPPDLDYHPQRMPRPRPMQPGPRHPQAHDGYHYQPYPAPYPPQFHQPRGPAEKRAPPPKKHRPHGQEGFTQPAPQVSGPSNGPKIDLNETEELNSMLNILGIQIGNSEFGIPTSPDDEKNFISKELYLLDDNSLKTFTKETDGSYFSNLLSFGENITKAAVDKAGKYLAVGSAHPDH